jgi:hypothetical protein
LRFAVPVFEGITLFVSSKQALTLESNTMKTWFLLRYGLLHRRSIAYAILSRLPCKAYSLLPARIGLDTESWVTLRFK